MNLSEIKINPDSQSRRTGVFPIMTAAEYADIKYEVPYVFEISLADKRLVYFGASHSRNPEDPMFEQIETEFNTTRPDVVLVEGVHTLEERLNQIKEWFPGKSREEIINQTGEPGYALSLALQNNVDVYSPEPALRDEISDLLQKGFSQEEIFAFYFAGQVPHYQQMKTKPEFGEHIKQFLNEFKSATSWESFEFTTENFSRLSERLWGVKFNPDTTDYEDMIDPIPWKEKKDVQGVSNAISRESSYFRDTYMVQEIQKLMKTHKKMFVVFGASHAVMQEPAIRKLFDEESS